MLKTLVRYLGRFALDFTVSVVLMLAAIGLVYVVFIR